jgi:hypothetical protein
MHIESITMCKKKEPCWKNLAGNCQQEPNKVKIMQQSGQIHQRNRLIIFMRNKPCLNIINKKHLEKFKYVKTKR